MLNLMDNKPTLTIIAGCNGAGKSTHSDSISIKAKPFDFDRIKLEKERYLKSHGVGAEKDFAEELAFDYAYS